MSKNSFRATNAAGRRRRDWSPASQPAPISVMPGHDPVAFLQTFEHLGATPSLIPVLIVHRPVGR